jgi:hypothetical protein
MGPIPSVDRKHLLGPYYQHICFVIKGISRTKQSNGMQGWKHEWFLRMILSKRFDMARRSPFSSELMRNGVFCGWKDPFLGNGIPVKRRAF